MMDSRRKHLPKESAEVRQSSQVYGRVWDHVGKVRMTSVVYLNLYSHLYLCILPKSQLRLPSATRCEGDLGTMLGSCGWPHRHSVWKAEWHTHYQTTSPFSDHTTSAGPWPCSSSNDWDQHICLLYNLCGWLTIVTTQLVLVRNTSSNMSGLVTTLHIGESVNLLHQPYWW